MILVHAAVRIGPEFISNRVTVTRIEMHHARHQTLPFKGLG